MKGIAIEEYGKLFTESLQCVHVWLGNCRFHLAWRT